MTTLYLAYGSNLNTAHMAVRCPTAKVIGSTVMKGYNLLFRGYNGEAYATVEETPQGQVPVLIWELDDLAEARLDHYEGYPTLYRKEYLQVDLDGKQGQAMVYIMNDGYPIGMPERHYYESILEGYLTAGFDTEILEDAVRYSGEYEVFE